MSIPSFICLGEGFGIPGILKPIPTTSLAFSSKFMALIISLTGTFPSCGAAAFGFFWADAFILMKHNSEKSTARVDTFFIIFGYWFILCQNFPGEHSINNWFIVQ